jgi:hypothetical protein
MWLAKLFAKPDVNGRRRNATRMTSDEFPADIKQFIADHIDSVAQLELLLLVRGDPSRAWTPHDAARTRYASADAIAMKMADLQSGRLLAAGVGERTFVYRPENAELAWQVDRLADLYQERRVTVITAIADAFRLRRERR